MQIALRITIAAAMSQSESFGKATKHVCGDQQERANGQSAAA
ncbi:MAG: hypothetical protein ABGZ53_10840 [Fuerstiella sp.]